MNKSTIALSAAAASLLSAGPAGATGQAAAEFHATAVMSNPQIWSAFAGGPSRVSTAWSGAKGPHSIANPRWIKNGAGQQTYTLYGQAGLVTTDQLVIALGYRNSPPSSTDSVVAFSRFDGSVVWAAQVPMVSLESWSAPAVDPLNDTVIVATGARLTALSLSNGSTRWTRDIGRPIVNASPVVTPDLGPRNRAFITDHSFGSENNGRLYCVNVSPMHPTLNPYQPGEIVWSVDLGGQTSGNTPAYRDGIVYVSTASGGSAWDQGTIRAYRADATVAPAPLWVYQHTDPTGFFSGVAVTTQGVYASSYSSHGGQFSASTVRLDRFNGQQRWSVPTNRADTTPVPMPNGMVLVSGGVPYENDFPFYGSLPSLQLIYENPWGGGATRIWDTAMDTLNDANGNGEWDPGESFLAVGGWTEQPIAMIRSDGKPVVYVGEAPPVNSEDFFGHSPSIKVLDLTRHPSDPQFVIQSNPTSGGSPALVGCELYAVGADGLHAFGAPCYTWGQIMFMWYLNTLPDFNGDGALNELDLFIALQYVHN